jgi:CheY-like chemotaxis protein
VISDSVLLLQYLSNLLSNATKFTSKGGVTLVCAVREEGPNWLEITLGVADSGPGIRAEAQRHVLQAFTTGDALPQEDGVGGAKGTGIGLRLADLIAHTIALPSLQKKKPEGGASRLLQKSDPKRGNDELELVDEAAAELGPNGGDAGLRIESPLEETHEFHVSNGGPGTFISFQTAVQRVPKDAIARHKENPSGEVEDDVIGPYMYQVKFSGTMRVLVVDDQRTMRQMVAMLYQKIAVEYPGVTIECWTAQSGEQAIRMCRTQRFHIITMDQQLSNEYCQCLLAETEKETNPGHPIPQFVSFGSDNLTNAKARQAYFKNDKWAQDICLDDGKLQGHEAIRQILKEAQEENRPPTLIFNLTGNVLEADRIMFEEVGSSGMLPKPIKVEIMLRMIQCNMGMYFSQGLIQLSGDKLVMDDGGLQIGVRSMKEVKDGDDKKTEANFLKETTGERVNFLKETTGERVMATGMGNGAPLTSWAGGATQRSAGAGSSTQNASNSSSGTTKMTGSVENIMEYSNKQLQRQSQP